MAEKTIWMDTVLDLTDQNQADQEWDGCVLLLWPCEHRVFFHNCLIKESFLIGGGWLTLCNQEELCSSVIKSRSTLITNVSRENYVYEVGTILRRYQAGERAVQALAERLKHRGK